MSAWFWFSNLTMQNDFKANELVLVCKTQECSVTCRQNETSETEDSPIG